MPKRSSHFLIRIWRIIFALVLIAGVAWWGMIRMPGKSFRGPLPELNAAEQQLRSELVADVEKLAGEIGERHLQRYSALTASADFIAESFSAIGFPVRRDAYTVAGKKCENIEAQLSAADAGEIIVIGAHYDTVIGSPGANDNGSGVAALLALARRFAGQEPRRTIRFVAFVNEEPGHFRSETMGSWVYAGRCKANNDRIAAMISLETIGCFSNEPGSQNYPAPGLGLVYPSAGNFIAFVGNLPSRALVRRAIGSFRAHARFPSEGAALPGSIPGIGWSDHWSFWEHGFPAIMITDTAPFRYAHYHAASDTPEKLDYGAMARVVYGMETVVRTLAGGGQ